MNTKALLSTFGLRIRSRANSDSSVKKMAIILRDVAVMRLSRIPCVIQTPALEQISCPVEDNVMIAYTRSDDYDLSDKVAPSFISLR